MKSIAYASSLLMATLISPAISLELTAQQAANPSFGTGEVAWKQTVLDPLGYHGTDEREWYYPPHSIVQFPPSGTLFWPRWITYDAAKFCTNAKLSAKQSSSAGVVLY